jgi:hypothetical protein
MMMNRGSSGKMAGKGVRGLLMLPILGLDGGRLDPLDVTPRIRFRDRQADALFPQSPVE